MKVREIYDSTNNRTILLKSFIIGIIVIALALLFGMHDESGDDTAIQKLIARPDSYTPFINRALSLALGVLFRLFPNVAWWFVFSITVIFFSVVAIAFVFLKKVNGHWQCFVSLAILVSCFAWALSGLNFTRTSTIASFAAGLLLLDAIFFGGIRRNKLSTIFAVLLFIIGLLIRKNGALLALGQILVLAFVLAVTEYFLYKRINKKQLLTSLCSLGVLFCLTFVFSAVNSELLTTEEKNFSQYNIARSDLHDYRGNILPFDGNEAFYIENNIHSEEDLNLFTKFVTEDNEVFTNESIINIAKKNSIQANQPDFNSKISNLNFLLKKFFLSTSNSLLGVFLIVIIMSLVIMPRKTILAILLELLSLGAIAFYFVLSGRVVGRVTDGVFAIVIFSLLYVFVSYKSNDDSLKDDFLGNIKIKNKLVSRKNFFKYLHCVLCFTIACVLFVTFSVPAKRTTLIKDAIDKQQRFNTMIEESSDIYISIPLNQFSNYMKIKPVALAYRTPPQNLFSLGGWNARIPSTIDNISKKGIDNPMRALFEDDRVLSEYDEDVLSYLQRRYDKNITASHIKTYLGVEIVKYSSPIQIQTVDKELKCDITVQTIKRIENKTQIDGAVRDLVEYPYLYVNIEAPGEDSAKTFRLEKDASGCFSAELYFSTAFDESNCSFIAKDKDGNTYLLTQ